MPFLAPFLRSSLQVSPVCQSSPCHESLRTPYADSYTLYWPRCGLGLTPSDDRTVSLDHSVQPTHCPKRTHGPFAGYKAAGTWKVTTGTHLVRLWTPVSIPVFWYRWYRLECHLVVQVGVSPGGTGWSVAWWYRLECRLVVRRWYRLECRLVVQLECRRWCAGCTGWSVAGGAPLYLRIVVF